MPYTDFASRFQRLAANDLTPARELTGRFEEMRPQFQAAGRNAVQGANANLDPAALRATLQTIAPPAANAQVDNLVKGFGLGVAMQGRRVIAPWALLTDANAVSYFDARDWATFGFNGAGGRPFENFNNVPDAVKIPGNIAMLRQASQRPFTAANADWNEVLSNMGLIGQAAPALRPSVAMMRQGGGGGGAPVGQPAGRPAGGGGAVAAPVRPVVAAVAGQVGVAQQGLTATEAAKITGAFANATFSFEFPPGCLVICIDRAAADTLGAIFTAGAGGVLSAIATAITAGVAAGAATLGGWLGAAIAVSVLYWGIMIQANKGTGGVCLHIPTPITLGIFGPGWAVGRG